MVNPCVTSGSAGAASTDLPGISYTATSSVCTLNDVTINLPSGGTVSGGLIMTSTASAVLSGAGTSTTNSVNWVSLGVTGTGGLAGLTGTGVGVNIAVTTERGQRQHFVLRLLGPTNKRALGRFGELRERKHLTGRELLWILHPERRASAILRPVPVRGAGADTGVSSGYLLPVLVRPALKQSQTKSRSHSSLGRLLLPQEPLPSGFPASSNGS